MPTDILPMLASLGGILALGVQLLINNTFGLTRYTLAQ